jgi:uncharacterized membrane protein
MSGTSLDGISAAAARFTSRGSAVTAELLAFEQAAYDPARRARIGSVICFICVIFYYAWRMNRLDQEFDVDEQ